MTQKTGAQALMESLRACGTDTYFTNPGTSEIHLVDALASEGVRSVLTLFEGVAAGAADGYGRMSLKPAATLLHLGPGQGNALANLHNARRARTPIVNIIGDHVTDHLALDPPLASDIEAVARSFSVWTQTVPRANDMASAGAAAAAAAVRDQGIATLIVPADAAWSTVSDAATAEASGAPTGHVPERADLAASLSGAKAPAVMLGGRGLDETLLALAGEVATELGATLYCETFFPRLARGAGRVEPRRLPYFPEMAAEVLKAHDLILLVGAREPVAFFAYPSGPGRLVAEGARVVTVAEPGGDLASALETLRATRGAPRRRDERASTARPELPADGPLTPDSLGAVFAALLPEGAIVSDESNTSGGPAYALAAGAAPHDWLTLTGGAIGQGLPAATGAAVACPDRKVIALQSDGSAMYTIQALWTQAREQLDVITLLINNRAYAILGVEYRRLLGKKPTGAVASQLDLSSPDLDFVSIARGMGVEASRATTVAELADQFRDALRRKGPRLIEVMLGR